MLLCIKVGIAAEAIFRFVLFFERKVRGDYPNAIRGVLPGFSIPCAEAVPHLPSGALRVRLHASGRRLEHLQRYPRCYGASSPYSVDR